MRARCTRESEIKSLRQLVGEGLILRCFACFAPRAATCAHEGAQNQARAAVAEAEESATEKRKFRPRCCAKTRAGAPCIMRVLPGKRAVASMADHRPVPGPWKAEPGLLKRSDVAGGRSARRTR